jgi:hypothetical protein
MTESDQKRAAYGRPFSIRSRKFFHSPFSGSRIGQVVSFQYFGKIVVTWWFRYGGGTAPPPTQPPIIDDDTSGRYSKRSRRPHWCKRG